MRNLLRVSGIIAVCVCSGWSLAAQEQKTGPSGNSRATVWQIGSFDESPSEFNNGSPGAPFFGAIYPDSLTYKIGESVPGVGWAGHQLGAPLNYPGSKPHPYAIQFDLKEIPKGLYTLKVCLLDEGATLGQIEITVNGHSGLFYLHPKIDYSAGTRAMVVGPIAGADTLEIKVPNRYLKEGTNSLILTAVDEPSDAADGVHSVITYDAIELEHDPTRNPTDSDVSVHVAPTVFYAHVENGLSEELDCFVRYSSPIHEGQLALDINGAKYSHPLQASEFGEQRVEFSVSEFGNGTQAKLTVATDGHTQRFETTISPARKWTLFVVPHVHVDVGYSDYQEKIAEIQSRELDEAMSFIRKHPTFRFSPDGYWSVRQYLAGRSDAERDQLAQMVRNKKIFVPTEEASLLTGFPNLETLIRSLYPGFEFNEKYGGDPNYANITDVPSYSWSYASVLAAAGVKYFAAGCDGDNGPILLESRLNEQSPFWWEGPDGGRILMWYSRNYAQLRFLFGGYESRIATGHESIPRFLEPYSKPGYKANAVLVYGSQIENTDLFPRQAVVAEEWNQKYAFPHFEYSGFADAIGSIAKQFGGSIQVVRGDGGPFWEYGIASTARSAAVAREAQERASAAEEFSTLSGLINPAIQPDHGALDQLWNNLVLYAEHTWGNHGSISDPNSQETRDQLAVKEAFAYDATRDVNYVLRRALAAIADSIPEPKDTLLVFNSLSWKRSNLVEMDLDDRHDLMDLVTQRPVPYEVLSTGKNYRRVRFLAQDVPAVGYKAFELKPVQENSAPPTELPGSVLENKYYRVVLDPATGSVSSILDKDLNKEIVNSASPYRFNQYLYVTGGDEAPNRLLEYSTGWPIPKLTIHAAEKGRILSIRHEPFGLVARLESQSMNTPRIETDLILFDDEKKIEFIDHVMKTEVYSKEGVYFAFPLSMDQPEFRYETQNGVVNPERDQLPGAGKEWFSVQHWVAADQGGMTVALVPVDASLVNLGDIQRGTWPADFGKRPGTIFSEVMNNYYYTNYAAGQGGDFTFRYVLTSGRGLEAGYLSRFGREEMAPLEVDRITQQDKALATPEIASAGQESFLQIDQPDVAVVTWKEAENGDGTILRLLEIGGHESEVNVEVPKANIKSVWATDALERNQRQLDSTQHSFHLSIHPYEIETVRLENLSETAH